MRIEEKTMLVATVHHGFYRSSLTPSEGNVKDVNLLRLDMLAARSLACRLKKQRDF